MSPPIHVPYPHTITLSITKSRLKESIVFKLKEEPKRRSRSPLLLILFSSPYTIREAVFEREYDYDVKIQQLIDGWTLRERNR